MISTACLSAHRRARGVIFLTLPDTPCRKYLAVSEEQLKEEIAEAKAKYFRAGDSALEKMRLRFGEGREGFLNLINNKDVENFSEKKSDND